MALERYITIVDITITSISFQMRKSGGERGIRTLEPLLGVTRFRVARLRPLGHLSMASVSDNLEHHRACIDEESADDIETYIEGAMHVLLHGNEPRKKKKRD